MLAHHTEFCIIQLYIMFFSPTQAGLSPLYVTCFAGHKLVVDTLLQNGANPNLTTTVSYSMNTCRARQTCSFWSILQSYHNGKLFPSK